MSSKPGTKRKALFIRDFEEFEELLKYRETHPFCVGVDDPELYVSLYLTLHSQKNRTKRLEKYLLTWFKTVNGLC